MSPKSTLSLLSERVQTCNKCVRLREHCKRIAQLKRKSYSHEVYWGKPVVGLGDPHTAQIVIIGLAPGAHGANRTGRIFTGDSSGTWLYRALHKAGLSNQAHSTHLNDGLQLKQVYITCIVKCAPPHNKPTRVEQNNCSDYLKSEISLFKKAVVLIALGQLAYQQIGKLFLKQKKKPVFQHGKAILLNESPRSQWLLLSYHPSQQNTFTGKLTEPMFDSIFNKAKKLIQSETT